MSPKLTKPAPEPTVYAAMPAAQDDRFSHAESKVFVYWLRREKQVPTMVFPLDYFYKMGIEVVIREVDRIAGITVTADEIKQALSPKS
jgi:hypothetical protein